MNVLLGFSENLFGCGVSLILENHYSISRLDHVTTLSKINDIVLSGCFDYDFMVFDIDIFKDAKWKELENILLKCEEKKLCILFNSSDSEKRKRIIKMGFKGELLTKSVGKKALFSAINRLKCVKKLATDVYDSNKNNHVPLLKTNRLTKRQREVCHLLLKGQSNSCIANELTIATATVDRHLYNIYKELGVRNRVEAVNLIKKNHLSI